MCVIHSRFSSRKGTMREAQAHPVFDSQERFAVFHNGFVSNYKELALELFPFKDPNKINLTDSELIALMIGKQLDQGVDLTNAIKNVLQAKLIGTWHLVIVPIDPKLGVTDRIFLTKNAGPFYIGRSPEQVVVC